MGKLNENKGQSTLEYLILFAAIVLIFVAFLRGGGPFSQRMTQSLDDATSTMTTVSGRLPGMFNGTTP